jgi:hypothetical protein
LFIMYMGHVLFSFFVFCFWNQNMAHVHDKQRIKIGNKTWPIYMINKE